MPEVSRGAEGKPRLSRREILKRTAYVVILGAGAGVAQIIHDNIEDGVEQQAVVTRENRRERAEAVAFAAVFKQGISTSWAAANVWPGLAVIPNDVRLFSTPALDAETEIDWPQSQNQSHLLVQRPFMTRQTARANLPSTATPDVASEVFGFWTPRSNDLVFCDRATNRGKILLATSASGKVWRNNYQGIVGQDVDLQPAVDQDGLTWRYLMAERIDENGSDGGPVIAAIETKVCGRSLWADPSEASAAFYGFETGEGNDLIYLPREQ